MKIKFKMSIAAAEWAYAPGQVAEVEHSLAEKWIASGVAEAETPEPAPMVATPAPKRTPEPAPVPEPEEPKKPVVAPLKSK